MRAVLDRVAVASAVLLGAVDSAGAERVTAFLLVFSAILDVWLRHRECSASLRAVTRAAELPAGDCPNEDTPLVDALNEAGISARRLARAWEQAKRER